MKTERENRDLHCLQIFSETPVLVLVVGNVGSKLSFIFLIVGRPLMIQGSAAQAIYIYMIQGSAALRQFQSSQSRNRSIGESGFPYQLWRSFVSCVAVLSVVSLVVVLGAWK